MNNAKFWKRIVAYFLDIMLISFVTSFLLVFIPKDKIDMTSANNALKSYNKGEITIKEYAKEISKTNESMEKSRVPSYLITLALSFGYFVFFQFKNKGQTLGKKILNIRVKSSNEEELTINSFIFRSLMVNEIGYMIINLILVFTLKGAALVYMSSILSMINFVLILICGIMILTREDCRGLHDIISKTKVVE